MTARGNAPGKCFAYTMSPEGAKQEGDYFWSPVFPLTTFFHSEMALLRAFSAYRFLIAIFPGRCPGLSCSGLSGQKTCASRTAAPYRPNGGFTQNLGTRKTPQFSHQIRRCISKGCQSLPKFCCFLLRVMIFKAPRWALPQPRKTEKRKRHSFSHKNIVSRVKHLFWPEGPRQDSPGQRPGKVFCVYNEP